MLEQSRPAGPVYWSVQKKRAIVSKSIAADQVIFGPMRTIQIYPITDINFWVEDIQRNNWYHYEKGQLQEPIQKERPDKLTGSGFFYYYGMSLLTMNEETTEEVYFLQHPPTVTIAQIPDVTQMELPLTLQTLSYGRIFSYIPEIKALCKDMSAAYADRFKRPIFRIDGRTYPIAMDKVSTKWEQLPNTQYPVVVDFQGTNLAVVDLEPTHTEDDLKHFQSLSGYYEEDTPRGGKHKVVPIEGSTFKFRYSEGLEIISQSQVTLYGIHGQWLNDEPSLLDTTPYAIVGHAKHARVTSAEKRDVTKMVLLLQEKARENFSTGCELAKAAYRQDTDVSHADYMVLWHLFQTDIKPYAKQCVSEDLPWILEAYAREHIPYREKHDTLRRGLPYLVYLAESIIGREWKP